MINQKKIVNQQTYQILQFLNYSNTTTKTLINLNRSNTVVDDSGSAEMKIIFRTNEIKNLQNIMYIFYTGFCEECYLI